MIFAFLRLLRIPNLMMIALCMYLVRICIIIPIFRISANIDTTLNPELMLHLNTIDFLVLVLSVVFIAAGGNVVNDYFDVEIDKINKPEKTIVGNKISDKSALHIYVALTIIGILLSMYASWKSGARLVLLVNLLAVTALWFYSRNLKKTFLLGNIIVSVLLATTVLVPALSETEFYVNFHFVLVYAAFAFLISMMREISKDVEDMEGDIVFGANTLPALAGIGWSKIIMALLGTALMAFIAFVLYRNFSTNAVTSLSSLLSACLVPFFPFYYLLFTAKEKKDFKAVSASLKIITLLGILSMIPLYYLFMRG